MNCQDREYQDKSKELFLRAKTYSDFLKLWSKFYINEICIPTYFSNFIGGEDNPEASKEIGDKFREIVSYGVIPTDFQTNNIKKCQKGYVVLFATEPVADAITAYINRYPGFVSFYQNVEGDNCIENLFVTYDPSKDDIKKTLKTGVFFGDPFTHLGYKPEDINFIQEWLSEPLKPIISAENFKHVNIIDTLPSEKSDRILTLLLNSLRDNRNLAKIEFDKLNEF